MASTTYVDNSLPAVNAAWLNDVNSVAYVGTFPNVVNLSNVGNITSTGNTTLGNATTDTLNVGNGGIIKDASGNVGFGVTPLTTFHFKSSVSNNFRVETTTARGGGGTYQSWYDPTGRKGYVGYADGADGFYIVNELNTPLYIYTNGILRVTYDSSGNQINRPQTTPPTLTSNGEFTFNMTSNTNLRFSYRGSDGVTRVANITLA